MLGCLARILAVLAVLVAVPYFLITVNWAGFLMEHWWLLALFVPFYFIAGFASKRWEEFKRI